MEVGGTLTAWLLPLLCLLSAIAIEWKWKYPHVHVSDFFRADPFNLGFVACGLAIIVIPLGWMIAIPAGDPAGVDRLYAKAIELGATDDGAPGNRNPAFYGAYVRDADGNKLCFYEMKM